MFLKGIYMTAITDMRKLLVICVWVKKLRHFYFRHCFSLLLEFIFEILNQKYILGSNFHDSIILSKCTLILLLQLNSKWPAFANMDLIKGKFH